METKSKNAKGSQGATAQAKQANNVKTANRPSIPGKEAKNDETTKNQSPAPAPQVEANKADEAKIVPAHAEVKQPANPAEQQQEVRQEEPKGEVKYIKPALNLEQTLKSVDGLHRLSIQRLALIARMKTLEAFEVKLIEENDQLESNPYQGCKLIIKDDKNREFTTNTPNLIRMVAQFIFDACNEKLTEIEANIVFPNA